MRANRHRTAGLACVLAVTATLVGGAASARATDVAVAGTELRIIDNGSEANGLEVRPSAVGYDILDDLTELTPGVGCILLHSHHASCLGSVVRIAVGAGGGDDVVSLRGVGVPVIISGGAGSDLIEGGINADRLHGGPGEDTILGEAGDDEITGAGGDDMLQGDDGGDRISGGDDADILQGQAGSGDVLTGNDGPDLVEGGTGDDSLSGGQGADVLVTGSGTDVATTGAGSDQVFGSTADEVTCGRSDEVRSGSARTPAGCGRLPSRESTPDIWPPPPRGVAPPNRAHSGAAPIAATGLSVQAATTRLPLPRGLFRGLIMHHGNARTIRLRIPSDYDMPIRVRIRTYTRDGRRVRTFRRGIRARRWATISTGGGVRVVWSARARCCVP